MNEAEELLRKEGGIEIVGTPKIVVAGGGSVVKTFKAETVELESVSTRKLSAASAEFKPIVHDKDSSSEASTESVPNKGAVIEVKEEETVLTERISSSLPGSKRKRRKRSILKKKNNNNNNGHQRKNNVEQIEAEKKEDCEIFQMEDVDLVRLTCLINIQFVKILKIRL